MLIPWSAFWERNYFGALLPALHAFITNNFVRGAISGLGLVNIWLAVGDLAAVVRARFGDGVVAPGRDG